MLYGIGTGEKKMKGRTQLLAPLLKPLTDERVGVALAARSPASAA